ncbi:MAG: glycosyltransferase family 4 protein [Chloroflexi bacterium]|nr:glycosyltransferase family 4 protein [Chloroflexota bacterium]
MHILLIHQAFAALNEPGGTRHHELALYLTAQGHRVTVITSQVSYLTGDVQSTGTNVAEQQDENEGVTILRVYTNRGLHRSFVHRIFNFLSFMLSSFFIGLSVKDVDLVWGTSPPIFQGITAWALARFKRAAFLFEVRDLWPAFAVAVGVLQNRLLIRASEWLEKFLYRRADQVMVNSPGYIEHVEQRGARQVALIPNGADTAMFDPQSDGAAFRKEHSLEGKFICLYAGAHGLSNDLGAVLQAAGKLRDNPDIAIVLLGSGKDKPDLIAQARAMGLDNVHFIPPVPKTDMPQALAAADACIAILKPISLYATVYPNKVFDYMAAGRPVLLAIDGVVREVVEGAEAGIFVQPGEPEALTQAIRQLAAQPDMAREMGLAGRYYVEKHFDRIKLASTLHDLINKTLAQKKV